MLTAEVERLDDRDVISRGAGSLGGKLAIGNGDRTHEDDRVATQSCGEDIGSCLGDVLELSGQIQIDGEQTVDGRIHCQTLRKRLLPFVQQLQRQRVGRLLV
jgi:hypothetical protein